MQGDLAGEKAAGQQPILPARLNLTRTLSVSDQTSRLLLVFDQTPLVFDQTPLGF